MSILWAVAASFALVAPCVATAAPGAEASQPSLMVVCEPSNDAWALLSALTTVDAQRFDQASDAVASASKGDGLLLLAAGYPASGVVIPAAVWATHLDCAVPCGN